MGSVGETIEPHEPLNQDVAVGQHSSLEPVGNTGSGGFDAGCKGTDEGAKIVSVNQESEQVSQDETVIGLGVPESMGEEAGISRFGEVSTVLDGEGVTGTSVDTAGDWVSCGEECKNGNADCNGMDRDMEVVFFGQESERVSQDETAVGYAMPESLEEEAGIRGYSLNEKLRNDSNVAPCVRGTELRGEEDGLGNFRDLSETSSSLQNSTKWSLGVMEEKTMDLVETVMDNENEIVSSTDCEILSETGKQSNLVQHSEGKVDKIVGCSVTGWKVERQSLSSQDIEMPRYSMPTTGVLEKLVGEVEQMGNNPVISYFSEEVSKLKTTNVETLTSRPGLGPPSDNAKKFIKKIQSDTKTDCRLDMDSFMGEKVNSDSDDVCNIPNRPKNQGICYDADCLYAEVIPNDYRKESTTDRGLHPLPSQGCLETTENSFLSEASPFSVMDAQRGQKNFQTVDFLSAERIQSDTRNTTNTSGRLQTLPSPLCLETMENSCMASGLNNITQYTDQSDSEFSDGHSLEEMSRFEEKKFNVATCMSVEVSRPSEVKADSPSEVKANCMKEGLPGLSSDSSSEKSTSPHLCWPFDAAESESSMRLDLSHCSVNRTVAINYGDIVDCLRETENQENEAGVGCISVPKYPDLATPSSETSNQLVKTGRKMQTKRASRNCRNKAEVLNSHVCNESIFTFRRRMRSSLLKSARSSGWGLVGNISQLFHESGHVDLNKKWNRVAGKSKVKHVSAKRKNNQTSRNLQMSGIKSSASLNCIRLKIKVGKKTLCNSLNSNIPEVSHTSASAVSANGTETNLGSMLRTQNLANGADCTMRKETDKHPECDGDVLCCEDKNSSDATVDALLENKSLNETLVSDSSAEEAAEDRLQVSSSLGYNKLGVTVQKSDTYPGTSPDSEVINSVPEHQVGSGCQQELPDITLPVKALDASGTTYAKKGRKKGKPYEGSHFLGDGTHGFVITNQRKPKKKHGRSKGDSVLSSEIITTSVSPSSLSNSSISKEISVEQKPCSKEIESGTSKEAFKEEVSTQDKISSGLDGGLMELESHRSKDMFSSIKSKRRKNSRNPDRVKRERLKNCDSSKSEKGNVKKKKEGKNKVKDRNLCAQVVHKVQHNPETGNYIALSSPKLSGGNSIELAELPNLDIAASNIMEQSLPADNAWVSCDDCHKWRRIPVALVNAIGHCEWFCKDNVDLAFADCSIPQEKTNEEINRELGISDAEEDVPDMSSSFNEAKDGLATIHKEYEFAHISTNQFLHRNRKTQTIDEIMVCHCKPPSNGGLGCGEGCLNRMLNIECVRGTCPCGDLCSNQQFQNRNYAQMRWDRRGKKGFGLLMEKDISEGQFLIEYVGEVLDMNTHEARQKEYASKGHKHFYFMTLNGSEVIDACAKGNLGRFINHSCDPNCRTEKWVVNGEICIGLFATRNIKKGEEVTFDYNYVRVFGAAAKKCYCGSRQCRGYIGGDPTSCEVIQQVDSDEEFPEPVMLEDGGRGNIVRSSGSKTKSVDILKLGGAAVVCKDQEEMSKPSTAVGKLEVDKGIEDAVKRPVSTASNLQNSLEVDNMKENFPLHSPSEVSSTQAETTDKSNSTVQQDICFQDTISTATDSGNILETSSAKALDKLSTNVVNKKSKSAAPEHKRVFVKSRFLIKKPRHSGSIKKVKVTSNLLEVDKAHVVVTSKSQAPSTKSKGPSESISNSRLETVEGKLNDLLDTDGGISKRKDAPKGYLKLLLLTAASVSGHGEAIQSNRDLSMILDALLKTKSRAVLMDIINKNGLQMLHNIMKQHRGDFRKIPILRKLLRVLEYLAFREILTSEQINGGPPCLGMESFQESMLSLTEHADKQVHQIARNFRDKWIPRHLRLMERDNMRIEFCKGSNCNKPSASQSHRLDQGVRSTDAIDCVAQSNTEPTSAVSVVLSEHNGESSVSEATKTRKRRSRWDQDSPPSKSFRHNEQKNESKVLQTFESPEMGRTGAAAVDKMKRDDDYCRSCVRNYHQYSEETNANDRRQNLNDDVPPGFSSPINLSVVSSCGSSSLVDVHQRNTTRKDSVREVIGHIQRRFNSRVPVSYGIPLPIIEQFGLIFADAADSTVIVPGVPFYPFPPIPPIPHHKREALHSCVNDRMAIDEIKQGQMVNCDSASCGPSEDSRNTAGDVQLLAPRDNRRILGTIGQHTFKRAKGAMNNLGRRYFRQQKWIKGPPWVKRHNQFANNSNPGFSNLNVGNGTNDHRHSTFHRV